MKRTKIIQLLVCLLFFVAVRPANGFAAAKAGERPDNVAFFFSQPDNTVTPAVAEQGFSKLPVPAKPIRYRMKYRVPTLCTELEEIVTSLNVSRNIVLDEKVLYSNRYAITIPFYYIFLFRQTLF